jgi:hypothetical protein
MLIGHGAVCFFIQRLLEVEPMKSENGVIFAVNRVDSKWVAKRV